mgnify:CR=1 FL=1
MRSAHSRAGRWGALAATALLLVSACAACGSTPAPATLGGDVVARVGGAISIPASVVQRTAAESHVSRDEALEQLVADAVGAREALEKGVDDRPEVRVRARAALARSFVERVQADSAAAGPPTAAEIATLTEEVWVELDHPELRVAVHAVVLTAEGQASAEARRLADRILAAVGPAKSADEFLSLADGPKAPGLEVRVEVLPAVAADGRMRGGRLDERFVKALFTLGKAGDQSGVTESAFGYHVIRLVERIPAYTMPLAERVPLFTPEVLSRRSKARGSAASSIWSTRTAGMSTGAISTASSGWSILATPIAPTPAPPT